MVSAAGSPGIRRRLRRDDGHLYSYPDYAKLIGDRRPPEHSPSIPVRPPGTFAGGGDEAGRIPRRGSVALVVRAPPGVEIEAADAPRRWSSSWPSATARKAPSRLRRRAAPGRDRPELLVDIQHGFRFGGRRGLRLSIVFGSGPTFAPAFGSLPARQWKSITEAADVTGTGRFDRADVKSAAGDVRSTIRG